MLQRLRTTGSGLPGGSYHGLDLSPRGLTWAPRSLAPGVYALLATAPPKNNNGIVAGDEAALVVDAGITPRVSRMLQEQVAVLTRSPVRYLVNTSHRGDHTFGNAAFPAAVQVLASVQAKAAMRGLATEKARLVRDLGDDGTALSDVTEWHLPAATFGTKLELDLGGVTAQLWHFGPGSSPGDAVVYVPQARTPGRETSSTTQGSRRSGWMAARSTTRRRCGGCVSNFLSWRLWSRRTGRPGTRRLR